jgi:hypothetical protein
MTSSLNSHHGSKGFLFSFTLVSIKFTFLHKKRDLRDTVGEWVFTGFTKEEASEVVGIVDDNGTSGFSNLFHERILFCMAWLFC